MTSNTSTTDELDEILYHVYESGTQSIGKWVRVDHFGKPLGPDEAHAKILALINKAVIEARINSLLDLEQWVKLHDLDKDMVLEGIEHMVVSLLQFPNQPSLDHTDRISALKETS